MLPLLLVALVAETIPRCSVSGTVVDSVTGKGLAKVDVTLAPIDRLTHHSATTTTDGEGRFSMVDVDPGAYRLTGKRSRYLDARQVMLQLDPDQNIAGLTYKLSPAGVIAGTVRDSDGEPVESAHVVIARRRGVTTEGIDSTDTDDQGHYRFGHLAPGKYFISAEPPSRGWDRVDHSRADGEPPLMVIPTFYPSVSDLSLASVIPLATGGRAEGVDVRLLRSRGYRVSGRVRNATRRVGLALVSVGDNTIHDFDPRTVTQGGQGEFEFRNVPPGTYVLMADAPAARVTVTAADVDGVEAVMEEGAMVRGTVIVEGDASRKVQGRVHLMSGEWGRYPPQIAPDGSFVLRHVASGTYRVEVKAQDARDLYVKSVRASGLDALKNGLAVPGSGAVTVEIVMARGGSVSGVITDASGVPVAGATAVVAGDEPRSAATDQYGRFRVDGLKPGEYRVYGWAEIEEDAWLETEFLKRYEGQLVRVGVGENAMVSVRASEEVEVR